MTDPIQFTIPLAPRTKKNHSRVVRRGRFTKVLPSEAYEKYERRFIPLVPVRYRIGIRLPVNVQAVYYLDANRRTDLAGLHQGLHDALVASGVLADDSAVNPAIVVSTDGSRVHLARQGRPRTEITITFVT